MIASSGVPGGDVLRLSRRALPNSPIGGLLAGGLFAAFFVGGDFVLDGIAGSPCLRVSKASTGISPMNGQFRHPDGSLAADPGK